MNQSFESFDIIVRDGVQLYGQEWLVALPKAAVIIVHGLGEHCSRYDHVAEFFNQHNVSVFGYDLRGHGRSEGSRGHTSSHDRMVEDLEEMLMYARAEYNELPLFVFGHSLGGSILTKFILDKNVNELKGVVISSPWFKTMKEVNSSKIKLAKAVSKVFPSFSQSNGLDTNMLTNDPNVNLAYQQDELVHDRVSVKLFSEFYETGQWILNNPSKIKLKAFIYHGQDDVITCPQATESFASLTDGKATFKSYPDTRHEPHNDLHKGDVLDDVIQWIEQSL